MKSIIGTIQMQIQTKIIRNYRGIRRLIKLRGIYYQVELTYNGDFKEVFVTTNVYNTIYWFMFGLLSLSYRCNIGISSKEIIEALKGLRNNGKKNKLG